MLYVSGQEFSGDKPKRVPSGRAVQGPMRAVVVVAVLLRHRTCTTQRRATFQRNACGMQFGNAGTILEPIGADALPGTVNYLMGNDSAAWRTEVPTFRQVRYGNVWDGINLVFHGRRQLLEYDFAVQPGDERR